MGVARRLGELGFGLGVGLILRLQQIAELAEVFVDVGDDAEVARVVAVDHLVADEPVDPAARRQAALLAGDGGHPVGRRGRATLRLRHLLGGFYGRRFGRGDRCVLFCRGRGEGVVQFRLEAVEDGDIGLYRFQDEAKRSGCAGDRGGYGGDHGANGVRRVRALCHQPRDEGRSAQDQDQGRRRPERTQAANDALGHQLAARARVGRGLNEPGDLLGAGGRRIDAGRLRDLRHLVGAEALLERVRGGAPDRLCGQGRVERGAVLRLRLGELIVGLLLILLRQQQLSVGLELELPRGRKLVEERIDVLGRGALGFQPAIEVFEDVSDQARPEVGVDVVPGVEADLRDLGVEVGIDVLGRQILDLGVHLLHEEGLARPPVPEHADRQRRLDLAADGQLGEGGDLTVDVQEVVRVGAVVEDGGQDGGETRDQPSGRRVGLDFGRERQGLSQGLTARQGLEVVSWIGRRNGPLGGEEQTCKPGQGAAADWKYGAFALDEAAAHRRLRLLARGRIVVDAGEEDRPPARIVGTREEHFARCGKDAPSHQALADQNKHRIAASHCCAVGRAAALRSGQPVPPEHDPAGLHVLDPFAFVEVGSRVE